MDRDLQSIQEVRDLVAKAKAAQAELAEFSQEKIDKICEAIAEAGAKNAERLAKMASEETGFGVWQDKILKNILGSTLTWNAIKNIKTALESVSKQRSDLGAVQNRLEHTIANLDNVVENTTAAESRIRDTDMATEMVKYSNQNILQQAGQAMLAQANQSNQGVLSLLG